MFQEKKVARNLTFGYPTVPLADHCNDAPQEVPPLHQPWRSIQLQETGSGIGWDRMVDQDKSPPITDNARGLESVCGVCTGIWPARELQASSSPAPIPRIFFQIGSVDTRRNVWSTQPVHRPTGWRAFTAIPGWP